MISSRIKQRVNFTNFIRYSQRSFAAQIFKSWEEAVSDIKDGSTLALGGFGLWGIPENLIAAIEKKDIRNLTCISNNGGVADWGVGRLMIKQQVKRMIGGAIMENKLYEKQYLDGILEVEFTPQGSLAEKLRAGGNGVPAFYTETGVGTYIEFGGFPIKNVPKGQTPTLLTQPKETKIFNGRKYLLETALRADYSLIKGWKADDKGNVIFKKSARNFNIDAAKAADVCIVEVEEIVPAGSIDPDHVHLPHIFVKRLIQWDTYQKRIEFRTTSSSTADLEDAILAKQKKKGKTNLDKVLIKRKRLAMRAAKEIKNGMYVNLGIGIPTLTTNFIPSSIDVNFQSENGILGMGGFPAEDEVDADWINAGKQTVSLAKGASFFSSSESFGMIRGRHIDVREFVIFK